MPNFKATFAIIILAGIAFGPETGFMVGAMTAFISNFFYGQGPYAPWQMIGYGAGGMLAGFLFRKGWLPRNRWIMAPFGFLVVILWIGPIMDISNLFLMFDTVSGKGLLLSLLSGFPINFSNGICTTLVLFLFGKPLLEKLDRVKLKYGMLE